MGQLAGVATSLRYLRPKTRRQLIPTPYHTKRRDTLLSEELTY